MLDIVELAVRSSSGKCRSPSHHSLGVKWRLRHTSIHADCMPVNFVTRREDSAKGSLKKYPGEGGGGGGRDVQNYQNY